MESVGNSSSVLNNFWHEVSLTCFIPVRMKWGYFTFVYDHRNGEPMTVTSASVSVFFFFLSAPWSRPSSHSCLTGLVLSLLSIVGRAAPLGTDCQRPLLVKTGVRLGHVCGCHSMAPHHHPLFLHPVRRPSEAPRCPLALGGRQSHSRQTETHTSTHTAGSCLESTVVMWCDASRRMSRQIKHEGRKCKDTQEAIWLLCSSSRWWRIMAVPQSSISPPSFPTRRLWIISSQCSFTNAWRRPL